MNTPTPGLDYKSIVEILEVAEKILVILLNRKHFTADDFLKFVSVFGARRLFDMTERECLNFIEDLEVLAGMEHVRVRRYT